MGWSSLWTALLLPALLLSPTADSLTLHPGCQSSCGGVDVPYPFGIGAGCFRPGFEIACVMRTTPVLVGPDTPIQVLSLSVTPRPEARVMLPVAYQCYNKTGDATDDYSYGTVDINKAGVYRISNDSNELFVLGCNTASYINSGPAGRSKYMFYTGCYAYCNDSRSAQDGACAGIGCCRVDIPPGLTDNWIQFEYWSSTTHSYLDFSPCDYAFLVEKGFYSFQVADLHMDGTQRTMPVRLDWAIRDSNGSSMSMSCAQAVKKSGYTCVSKNSDCVDSINGPGYFCNCTKGYEGNPYVPNGCTDINECERPQQYPCHGKCHDREGYYDCTCPSGYESNGDPKETPCNPKFPLAAQITLGTVLSTSVFVIALLAVVITFQKRQLFRKNGGNILKNVDSLMFFTEREMKKITRNYRKPLGEGGFGKVYKGKLPDKDGTKVAVKRSVAAITKVDEFVKEVEIQSRMIHKNVLRLKGCCLEVKCPMLVYEYAAKGSLQNIIHGKDGEKPPFPLEQRLDIAIGSAEGLAYMHTYTGSTIRHGDVKPDNILLDEKFVPKLADFGLSSLLATGNQDTTGVVGCIGYMDPALPDTKVLTPENDVYSFGVVLLELIARKPIEPGAYNEECGLVAKFRQVYKDGSSSLDRDNTNEQGNYRHRMLDKDITSEQGEDKQNISEEGNNRHRMLDEDIATKEDIPVLEGIVTLAFDCLGKNRPGMTEVARRLAMLKKEWKHGMTSRHVTNNRADETATADTPDRMISSASASKTQRHKLPLLKT